MFDFDAIKKAAANVYDYFAAYSFNEERGYSKKAIKIIRTAVGVAPLEMWDAAAISAVERWQAAPQRLKPLDADGKFGAKSLGVLIAELERKGDTMSVAILKQFSYKDVQTGQVKNSPSPMVEVRFNQMPKRILALTKDPSGSGAWEMKGSFKVIMNVDPTIVEPWRYEYRQYIKGKVILNQPSSEEDMKDQFKVPGGLNPNEFTEDGEKMPSGIIERFGYRNKPPTYRPGLMDYYSHGQQGPDYFLEDTFGIEGTSAGNFHKIAVNISYRGVVIKDGKELTRDQINSPNFRDYCIAGNQWNYSETKFF
ncbi:MAG: hypothetical protein ABL984_11825 [Pyrinomonadaceae bacterium]